MRWFIVFLLIANILLFFWVQQESLRPSPQSEMPPPEIGRLRLLNESPESEVNAVPEPISPADDETAMHTAEPVNPEAAPTATEGPQQSNVRVAKDNQIDPSGQAESSRIMQPTDSSGAPESAEAVVPVERIAELPGVPPEATQNDVAKSAGSPAEPEVVIAPPLPLLGDAASTIQDKSLAPQPSLPPSAVVETSPVPPTVCARVGPLKPADADALLQNLPSRIELLSDTSEEKKINDGYFVLIPALPDRAAGLNKLQELEAAGFKDTWLFPRGPNRNAISLGLFSKKVGAERQASQVAAKGFEVEVRARTATAQRRYLRLKQVGGEDMRSTLSLPDGITLTLEGCP